MNTKPTQNTRIKDLAGMRFGRLLVTEHGGSDASGRSLWLCLCDCGKTKTAQASSLRKGNTRSCGCLGREVQIANGQKSGRAQMHSLSKSENPREYSSWESMIERCYSPKAQGFHRYGGRGIAVCEEWRNSFAQFFADMGKRPEGASIERMDTNGHYCPENCKWATRTEQANNRRNNHLVTANGTTQTLARWAAQTGIKWHTIYTRLQRGWSGERAVSLHG
jgi:hypothetical protein